MNKSHLFYILLQQAMHVNGRQLEILQLGPALKLAFHPVTKANFG
jgi:hypothetical protein